MSHPIYTVDLSPRPNVHREESLLRDVLEVCGIALLAFVLYVIVLLLFLMTG